MDNLTINKLTEELQKNLTFGQKIDISFFNINIENELVRQIIIKNKLNKYAKSIKINVNKNNKIYMIDPYFSYFSIYNKTESIFLLELIGTKLIFEED
jgi:hypothetical protein